jgi:2-keto-4-pentenoate hydratase
LSEGLAIQREISRRMGFADLGWKVAVAEDGTAIGGLMPGPWLAAGETYEGAPGAELRVEIEIALRLARDVPLRPGQPYSRAELLDHCDKAYLGIEIVEGRLANWSGKVAMPLWLTDAMGHGGYFVVQELDKSVLDDLSGLDCFISLDGATIYDRPAVHGNGDPMVPFLAWANRKEEGLGPLKAGQLVTTGSLCGGVLAPGKGRILCKLNPLGEVSFTLR